MDAVADRIEGLFAALGDLFAPPEPPTKEQAEGMQRAAEEQQTQAEADHEAAEKEARLQELLEQIKRDDEQARYDRYTGRSRDNDDDYDRGRERER